MALDKPTIVITQSASNLPFDIADIQTIRYSRSYLRTSLAQPLKEIAIDTIASIRSGRSKTAPVEGATDKELATLRSELSDVKKMLSEVVYTLKPSDATPPSRDSDLQKLSGAWVNSETGSHAYASLISGELVVPYSYSSNKELTGVYFGWRRMGDYW